MGEEDKNEEEPGVEGVLMSWMGRLLHKAYSNKYLLYTNTVTSCSLLCAADVLQQIISKDDIQPLDRNRTGRMTTMGLVLGPMTHYWYKILDAYSFRGSRTAVAVKKIICDIFVAPFFSCTAITGLALLEGQHCSAALAEYRHKFWHVFLLDICVWPPVQFFNFFFLPPSIRVLYVNCFVLGYNCALSYIKHDHKPAQSTD